MIYIVTCEITRRSICRGLRASLKPRRVGSGLEEKWGDVRSRDGRVRKCLGFTLRILQKSWG